MLHCTNTYTLPYHHFGSSYPVKPHLGLILHTLVCPHPFHQLSNKPTDPKPHHPSILNDKLRRRPNYLHLERRRVLAISEWVQGHKVHFKGGTQLVSHVHV